MFGMDDLSIPAKAEAMRYGYTAVIDAEDVQLFLDKTAPFLEDHEQFAIKPLSTLAGSIHLFSVRITPSMKRKIQPDPEVLRDDQIMGNLSNTIDLNDDLDTPDDPRLDF